MSLENLTGNTEEEKQEFVTNFQDPFVKEGVNKITIEIENYSWSDGIEYKARVSTCMGDTQGWQKFKADDFVSLVTKVETFIQSLK